MVIIFSLKPPNIKPNFPLWIFITFTSVINPSLSFLSLSPSLFLSHYILFIYYIKRKKKKQGVELWKINGDNYKKGEANNFRGQKRRKRQNGVGEGDKGGEIGVRGYAWQKNSSFQLKKQNHIIFTGLLWLYFYYNAISVITIKPVWKKERRNIICN